MATEKIDGDEAPKKNIKLTIIIVVLLLVLGGGGGAAWFMMKGNGDEGEQPAKKVKKKDTPPVYFPMDVFTVNLIPEVGEQYLQVTINIEAEDTAAADAIKIYTPRLRHEITNILSSKRATEVASREGKVALSEEIRLAINDIVDGPAGRGQGGGAARAVLFTTFIIQ